MQPRTKVIHMCVYLMGLSVFHDVRCAQLISRLKLICCKRKTLFLLKKQAKKYGL